MRRFSQDGRKDVWDRRKVVMIEEREAFLF